MEKMVAVVTGGATGVGRACALQFADKGLDVVINYSKSEAEANEAKMLVEERGCRAMLIQCDVSNDRDVIAMMDNVAKAWGRIDVLVNNAATTEFVHHADLAGMTEEAWDQILGVNLKAPFFCVRAAEKYLKASGKGAVVNVSSTAGIRGEGSSIAYCASKGGLNTMTKSLAVALGPDIRVNAVCPGPIDSRWLKRVMTEETLKNLAAEFPIPRPAQPDDIADAVVYLALGTTLTTGQLLVVDGGRTV